jgi:hypothetical protein
VPATHLACYKCIQDRSTCDFRTALSGPFYPNPHPNAPIAGAPPAPKKPSRKRREAPAPESASTRVVHVSSAGPSKVTGTFFSSPHVFLSNFLPRHSRSSFEAQARLHASHYRRQAAHLLLLALELARLRCRAADYAWRRRYPRARARGLACFDRPVRARFGRDSPSAAFARARGSCRFCSRVKGEGERKAKGRLRVSWSVVCRLVVVCCAVLSLSVCRLFRVLAPLRGCLNRLVSPSLSDVRELESPVEACDFHD